MEFAIANGPWTLIFKGLMEGHSIENYSNNKDLFLSIVLDEKDNKVHGALIQIFKVMQAEGMLEEFIDTLPKNALSFSVHQKENTYKFFILSSEPAYALFNEEDFINTTNELFKKLEITTKIISDVSKIYDLKLTALNETKKEVREAFYGMPLISLMLSPIAKITTLEAVKESPAKIQGEIILGKRETQIIKEPFEFFLKTIVVQGKENERMHALNILIETSMLLNMRVIAFQFLNEFNDLNYPNENKEEIKAFGITLEPIGFPVKEFNELKAELNLIEGKILIELFGLGNTISAEAIAKLVDEKKPKNIKELIDYVKALPTTEELTEFNKRKTIRILNLIELIYPNFFSEMLEVNEIFSFTSTNISRTNLIKLSKLDEKQALLVIYCLLKKILEMKKEKTIIFIPEVTKIISLTKKTFIQEKIKETIINASKQNIGFVLSAKTELDLPKEIINESNAKISLIEEKDAAITIKGTKPYRLTLRPCLSKAE